MNKRQLALISAVIAALIFSVYVGNAMAYTLDANVLKVRDNMLGTPQYQLNNIRITDLPDSLHATNATLITLFGTAPTISLNPTYVGFSGSLKYQTPDGASNMASTMIVPDIKKIKNEVYTLKSFVGPHGELDLKAGTLHLEDINDPKGDN